MKTEDQDLLLKDLCGRLPYWVKCIVKSDGYVGVISSIESQYGVVTFDDGRQEEICDIKPCLYPLSSMTEEQNKILIKNYHFSFNSCSDGITNGIYSPTFNRTIYYSMDEDDISKIIDWLNKNHFDYRGLIEKGLAIDATGLNIYKEEIK